eukprot:jgi/Ulvmu1/1875/UM012_0032.1
MEMDDQGSQKAVMSAEKVLEVMLDEATGVDDDSNLLWDADFTEGFMKVELRGPDGSKPVKLSSKTATVTKDHKLIWHEPLHFDLFEGAAELRMLLCRDQTANGKRTVHVVTACGIFVQHILDAAPIDKYFEMFKPGSGSEGGFVRLKMRLLSGPDAKKSKGKKGKGGPFSWVGGLLAGTAFIATSIFIRKRLSD